jgi:hypothetical protein
MMVGLVMLMHDQQVEPSLYTSKVSFDIGQLGLTMLH